MSKHPSVYRGIANHLHKRSIFMFWIENNFRFLIISCFSVDIFVNRMWNFPLFKKFLKCLIWFRQKKAKGFTRISLCLPACLQWWLCLGPCVVFQGVSEPELSLSSLPAPCPCPPPPPSPLPPSDINCTEDKKLVSCKKIVITHSHTLSVWVSRLLVSHTL